MNSGPAPSLAACSVSSCRPLFTSGAGPPNLTMKGGVKCSGISGEVCRSAFSYPGKESLRSRRPTLRPPKTPDESCWPNGGGTKPSPDSHMRVRPGRVRPR